VGGGLSPTPALSDHWKTWLKLVMLENLQACFYLGLLYGSFNPEFHKNFRAGKNLLVGLKLVDLLTNPKLYI
jgi:hypothetical protein